ASLAKATATAGAWARASSTARAMVIGSGPWANAGGARAPRRTRRIGPPARGGEARLLMAKGLHGVECRGPPCGNVAEQHRDRAGEEDGQEGGGDGDGYVHPGQEELGEEGDAQAEGGAHGRAEAPQEQGLQEELLEDVAPARPQRLAKADLVGPL